jgi:hypothetical protein
LSSACPNVEFSARQKADLRTTAELTLAFYPCLQNQTACGSNNVGNVLSQTIAIPAIGNVPVLNLTQTYTYDAGGRVEHGRGRERQLVTVVWLYEWQPLR